MQPSTTSNPAATTSADRPRIERLRAAFGALRIAMGVHRWFGVCALASVLAFAWVGTGGTGRLFHTEAFGDFYDHQAASLLKGRLDVPMEALCFEAFLFEGKVYGYFGITPALLRVPFTVLGIGFGELTRVFMLGYFAVGLLAAYLILLHALRLAGSDRPAPTPWITGLLVANAGLGNTFLFLGSRSYVYHEAILCGAVFALWSVWCALRHLAAPNGRWWMGALVCGVLSVHARPPTGLFALTTIGVVACVLAFQRWRKARADAQPLTWAAMRHPLLLAGLAAAGVLTFNALGYLKFRTFNGCPLEYHVQYDAASVARFEGRQFHLANVPFGANAYLLRPSFSVSKHLPYLNIGDGAQHEFPKAKMDWVEPLLAFPYVMPGLFALATLGCAGAFTMLRPTRPAIAVVWLAGLPVSLVMFAAVAHSHRYTADFCPLFIAAAAFALAALEISAPRRRRTAGTVVTVLTVASLLINLLLALHYRGAQVWGVPAGQRQSYAALRKRVDALFGQANPDGYNIAQHPARRVDAAYHTWLVNALVQKPETLPRAIAIYERELRDQLYFADAHFAVSDVYAAMKDRAKAIVAIEKGLAVNPNVPKAQARLGELLAESGRVPEAIERYKAALQLVPNYVLVHNNLGAAYARMGQLAEAIRHIERAQELDPNHVDARENLEKLKALQKTAP